MGFELRGSPCKKLLQPEVKQVRQEKSAAEGGKSSVVHPTFGKTKGV